MFAACNGWAINLPVQGGTTLDKFREPNAGVQQHQQDAIISEPNSAALIDHGKQPLDLLVAQGGNEDVRGLGNSDLLCWIG
jgi:hypothetical protein